ncbi:hypothetical protein SKAU_G00177000 [Synaphobranchus kaupii]|uniref:RING-type E3 ubiquitin transferase n=1 Tax=Synaphobranchus kaupii TaxID=118154 RepID=A0A9Q1FM40_SYNKA|nr:hypothetical protein SKAU_G00177000 [Synaphobranchus kaupii]
MSVLTEPEFPPPLVCLKNVEALLRCPICFDYLNITMMTKCSHNFCSLCIRKFLSYKLQCPVCNLAMTELDLRNNRLLDDLVVSFQAARLQLSQTNLDSPSVSPKTLRPNVKRKAANASRAMVGSTIMNNFLQRGNPPSSSSSSSSSSSLMKRTRLQPPCNDEKNLRQDPLKMIRAVKVELVQLPARMRMTLMGERVKVPSQMTWTVKEEQAEVSAQVISTVKERRVEVPEQGARNVKEERVVVPTRLIRTVQAMRAEVPTRLIRTVKEERVEVPTQLSRTVKEETVEIPELGTRNMKKEMVEEPATESSSGLTSGSESPSTSQSMKAVVKVECPVCSVGIPEHQINRHLDSCLVRDEKKESLRSSTNKRKPLTKLVYHLLTIHELRKRLRDLHLPTQGSRDQLVRRHKEYMLMYNSECDSLSPKSVACGDIPCKMQPNAAQIPPAEEPEVKEWTILDSFPDDELFYGSDDLFITSTADSTLSPAFEEPTLPLPAPEPTLAPAFEEPTLPLPAPEPTLAQATAPQPSLAPALKPPIREPCGHKCRRKCIDKFSEDRRREIWGKYWDMPYPERHAFIFYSVSQVPTAKVSGDGKPSRRGRSFIYRLNDEAQVPQQVCKTFFLSTLGYHPTNSSLVVSMMEKEIASPLAPPKDQRGRHAPANKLDLKPVYDHIESFHPTVSHYRREHAPGRRYLPSDINIKLMHADYVENGNSCSYESYRKAVKSKNISFTKLGEEECESCLLQEQHMKADHQGETAAETAANCPQRERWQGHEDAAAESRLHYRADAKRDWPEDTSARSVDQQEVIMFPRMPGVKSAVFTRRIAAYHETFASVGSKQNE